MRAQHRYAATTPTTYSAGVRARPSQRREIEELVRRGLATSLSAMLISCACAGAGAASARTATVQREHASDRRGRGFAVVSMSAFDDDPGVRPERHIYVDSKASWDEITDGLPTFPGPPLSP